MKNQGFTIIEIVLVLGIFAILLTVSIAAFGGFRGDSQISSTADAIQAVLRLAQNRTVSSEGDAQYGVYFNTGTSPHEYVLFQGTDYVSRVVAEDQVYKLPNHVQFSLVDFNGGQEVVFDRIQGTTSQAGIVVLENITAVSNTRTISVNESGAIEIGVGSAASDADRITDTRHMHVTYAGREIMTASETITLDFGGTTYDIVIADYLSGGQIDWEGTIDVGGEDQTIKVHTHALNDTGFTTEFSIHRDRRFNTQPLTITISGDGTGTPAGKIIEYDAAGQVIITGFESSYVTATQEQ